jgi:ParB family chromosome partitioning protein
MVHERKLTEGHARALLGLAEVETMMALARQAVDEGWSVREMEARVRGDVPASATAAPASPPRRARPAARTVTADVRRVEDALRKHLGTDVRVTTRRRGRGFLTVSYYSNDDLARLLELILGRPFQG